MVRAAGASEVHVRIGSPITRFPCYYGVDTPLHEELIGNRMDREEIREHITADSLAYTTVEGLRECLGNDDRWCMACFDGKYPLPITEHKKAL
jgi:amidophosphoribosyltransferase